MTGSDVADCDPVLLQETYHQRQAEMDDEINFKTEEQNDWTTFSSVQLDMSREDHICGGIPIVVMLGDFMQLGAMEQGLGRVSLIMKPKLSWYDDLYGP